MHYLDLAKGVCILLVVLFHFNDFRPIFLLLTQLRMPLYFFLSGVFFRTYNDSSTFLKKKINNLIIPLIFFDLMYVALSCIASHNFDLTQYHFTLLSGQVNDGPL